jgi:glutathione S-transferase
MSVTFYYLSGSPFAWKVWLALEYKGVPYELKLLSVDAGDLKNPEFAAINPRKKVPAIVDDGFVLYESAAIVDYLEDCYADRGPRLWPQDVKARALARRVALEADGYIYPQVRKLALELLMRREGRADEAGAAEAKSQLVQEFSMLEQSFAGHFVVGEAPTAADFALYPMIAILERIQVRRPDCETFSVVPEYLRAWKARVEALPFFATTYPPHWRS